MSPRLAVLAGLALLAAMMVGLARITGGDGAKPHPLRTEVVVGYTEFDDDGQRGARTQIGLTVLAVRSGTQEELEANGLEVDAEDRDAAPFYIDARFTNKGPNAVTRRLGVGLEDSDGDLVRQALIFGAGNEPFRPCARISAGTLRPGESYEGCTLVLVPEGVDAARVYFLSDNGPDEEPEFVYWAVE